MVDDAYQLHDAKEHNSLRSIGPLAWHNARAINDRNRKKRQSKDKRYLIITVTSQSNVISKMPRSYQLREHFSCFGCITGHSSPFGRQGLSTEALMVSSYSSSYLSYCGAQDGFAVTPSFPKMNFIILASSRLRLERFSFFTRNRYLTHMPGSGVLS